MEPTSKLSQSAKIRLEALSDEPVMTLLLRLSLPAAVALLCTALYNMVDTFWVARLGPTAVAGVTVIFPVQLLIAAAGTGTGVGLAALCSRLLGERAADEPGKEAARAAAGHVLPLALLLGLPFVALALLGKDPLLTVLGAGPTTRTAAAAYVGAIALAAPVHIFVMLVSNLLRAAGDTTTPMKTMIGAALLNALLDPLLIFGAGPIPALGVKGAAIATAGTQLLAAIHLAWYVGRGRTVYRNGLFSPDLQGALVKDIYRVGVPAAMATTCLTLVVSFHNHILAPFGAVAVGSYGLLFRIYALVFMPSYGICQGLLPIVGHAAGAGRFDRVRQALYRGALVASAWGACTGAFVILASPTIAALFKGGPALTAEASIALRIAALGWFVAGPQLVWTTGLHALGRGGASLFLLATKLGCLLVPLVLVLSHTMGVRGVWLAQPLAEAGGFIIALTTVWRLLPHESTAKRCGPAGVKA